MIHQERATPDAAVRASIPAASPRDPAGGPLARTIPVALPGGEAVPFPVAGPVDLLAPPPAPSRAPASAPASLTPPRGVEAPPLPPRTYLLAKRLVDVTLTALALGALSPLLAVIAALIKLEDGGPVLFSQTRVGEWGRLFRFYKFRSMRPDAEQLRHALKERWAAGKSKGAAVRFKMDDDPRITRVGAWLRRFSLDELPQLWNILVGDMSLVGPRPPLPEEVAEYGPSEWRRLGGPQGLTCVWQVSGRALIPFEQQVEMDVDYLRRRSFGLDLSLLFRTIPAVLGGKGAH